MKHAGFLLLLASCAGLQSCRAVMIIIIITSLRDIIVLLL